MGNTTLYSAMYGVIAQSSLANLENWREVVKQEIDHPTNKTVGWDNREHKLSVRLQALDAIIAKRRSNQEGVRSGIMIGNYEQLRFPE
jgi:hypothetical protein